MKKLWMLPILLAAVLAGGAMRIVQDQCGPLTDVTPAFCPFVSELYYLGITAGTSATTFSPDDPLTRGQAAVFVAKGLNQSLARSSRRAALGQWWTTTPKWGLGLGSTTVGAFPVAVASDGTDLWVANFDDGSVSRVRASDGKLLGTWTGASKAYGILVAMDRIFVTGFTGFGQLYMIDPTQPEGSVTIVTTTAPIPSGAGGLGFDGSRIWIASFDASSISIVTPAAAFPWDIVSISGPAFPKYFAFDGENMWMTSGGNPGLLNKLSPDGQVSNTVLVGSIPGAPVFDGANIWVPDWGPVNQGPHAVSVVRAGPNPGLIATLTGNGLSFPVAAAFDGERVLVSSMNNAVSLFLAADFTPLGSRSTGDSTQPRNPCSDGAAFWIPLANTNQLVRF